MKASWANDVVNSLTKNAPSIKPNDINSVNGVTKYSPFDPLYVDYDGTDWSIILQPGYLLSINEAKTDIGWDGDYLSYYPSIVVEGGKDLYYHWENNELLWDNPDLKGLLKILETRTATEGYDIFNVHPDHIYLSEYSPFYPLLCKDGSTYRVKLTRGTIIERDYSNTADGMVYTDVDSTYATITDGQQISLVIATDTHGKLTSATMEIEDEDEPSTCYYPSVAGVPGRNGDYHIKMAVFTTANGLEFFGCGSNVDFYHDIPLLDNCANAAVSATPDIGRVLKEFELNDGKYVFRDIKPGGGQLTVEEQANTILVSGNSLSGSLTVNVDGTPLYNSLEWSDGLITDSGDIVWNISLSASSLSSTSFSSVEVPFYCWINGNLGTVTVHCTAEPTIL